MKHVVFFSRSGQEIYDVCLWFKRWPDLIVTNQRDWGKVYPGLKYLWEGKIIANTRWRVIRTPVTLKHYTEALRTFDPADTLVTLHGWLRIVPAEICDKWQVFNNHPGDIITHPELKGKDPQNKVWDNMQKYPTIGSVVHRVTAGIDEGPIVERVTNTNRATTKEELYDDLRHTSYQAWIKFLKDRL
jgi:methionyl-tRNA formyltransferase